MEKNKANTSLRLLTLGDRAIAVEFGQAIELDINQRVMALRDKIQQTIQQGKLAGIVKWYLPIALSWWNITLCLSLMMNWLRPCSKWLNI